MTKVIVGDALDVLRTLDAESIHCCVTSPPYFGLRDYGVDGQIGLEPSPKEYVARIVEVFREVRRVLRKDGTCWVNLGDSYAGSGMTGGTNGKDGGSARVARMFHGNRRDTVQGFAQKNLLGIPWRVAFALQDDGWYLRSDIIWAKPNPMPESVTDRPTRAHEYLFLLSRSPRYWYDAGAIREGRTSENNVCGPNSRANRDHDLRAVKKQDLIANRRYTGFNERWDAKEDKGVLDVSRNARTVWTVATQPYSEAHFATFPEEIPKRCILAGCPEHGTVLDPFLGSGTTLAVAKRLGRDGIGIELNAEYAELAEKRIAAVTPSLFAEAPL